MAALIFWGTLVLTGYGQTLPDWQADKRVAKPPDYGVLDEGGFFSRDSGVIKRISEQIRKLEADHGFRIYLVVERSLLSENGPELAARLQQSWLPEGDGLVVVYESDSRGLAFGRDFNNVPGERKISGLMPTHETSAILIKVQAGMDANLAPEAYVETLIGKLTKEFSAYFERRNAPPPAQNSLRLGLLALGVLTLLALGAIAVGSLARLPSMKAPIKFRFPTVDRPERLGAPCGGGNVTSRRFKSGTHS